jgi:hypothetical protein
MSGVVRVGMSGDKYCVYMYMSFFYRYHNYIKCIIKPFESHLNVLITFNNISVRYNLVYNIHPEHISLAIILPYFVINL